MSSFRTVTPTFSVAPQIAVDDLAAAKAEGFSRVINNRPDGEAMGQPSSAAMSAAAELAGLDYVWNPIVGAPTPEQADTQALVASGAGRTLAFCRSGTRSITAWAMGQARSGALSADELVRLGEGAGYDLSWLR
jgi:uncharacterized protein (TIGR01244 family)